jgi:hypothetical protein
MLKYSARGGFDKDLGLSNNAKVAYDLEKLDETQAIEYLQNKLNIKEKEAYIALPATIEYHHVVKNDKIVEEYFYEKKSLDSVTLEEVKIKIAENIESKKRQKESKQDLINFIEKLNNNKNYYFEKYINKSNFCIVSKTYIIEGFNVKFSKSKRIFTK